VGARNFDWRDIRNGWEIPTESYSDQPYVVKTDDDAWLCVMTTGAGREGQAGQHVVTLRSEDRGRTWDEPVAVEPADGPEASYAVLLKVPSGRLYVFYNHNTDNVRRVRADNPPYRDGYNYRVDSLGHFVFKYSDDHGRTWSAQRFDLPMREMAIDRENANGGKLKYFWNVGKPFVLDGAGFVSLHKVGGFGDGFFTRSEGVLLRSENILEEQDASKLVWETLPDGDAGLRTPPGGGTVAEEQSYCVLSDGSIYAVYRTIDGYPVNTYSRDGGRTWSEPQYKRFADGRVMKHPRAANFAWRCEDGTFLYWFHNHGGRFIREHPQQRANAYNDRNPVWLCAGLEADGPDGKVIKWTQPEIVLYDDDPFLRMSYPDLLEDRGTLYLTETQKDKGRVHEVDAGFLAKLKGQFDARSVARDGLSLEVASPGPMETDAPEMPTFLQRDPDRHDYGTRDLRAGFTLELSVRLEAPDTGQVLLDNRLKNGKGFCVRTSERGTVEIVLNDGRTESAWRCDPDLLTSGVPHHLGIVVDGGPKVISFTVDGALCDGGEFRQFGWGRYDPNLRDVNGSDRLRIGQGVTLVRIYSRALMTSELIGNLKGGITVAPCGKEGLIREIEGDDDGN
jgi:hypothetical protein